MFRKIGLKTEHVDKVLRQILEGENADELISSLKPVEKDLFYQLLDSLREDNSLVDELWRVDYRKKPPEIGEFINDDYWLGQVTRPENENSGIFPIWRDRLLADFDLDSRIHNLVITGSLGIGKSWCMAVIFLYRLVMATLLRNPQNFLGLSRGSTVVYSVMSVTKSVVKETVFGDVINFMTRSPYFIEECHFNPDLEYSSYRVPMPSNILLTAGSRGQHVIGRNTMGVCLDEGNWRLDANPDVKAYVLYDEIRTRIKNRFQKVAGFLPAISVLASSARDESSFTEKIIAEIESVKDDRTEKVYRYAVYEARRHQLTLKERWFKVAHGLKNMDPMILEGWYREDGTPIEDAENPREKAPPGARISLVPEDYIDAFKRNCKVALQSVCGVSTGGSHLLFSSTVDVERCFELAERDGVRNPARVEFMPISMEDTSEIWDFLDHRSFCTTRFSQVIPLRHPEAKRFGHIDLATATMAGVGICHLVGSQRVDGLVKSGIVYSEYRLIVEYDFILTIVAGKTKPISLEKIQRFFFWLRQECGFTFGLITADSFQSVMPLQMMQARGFETKVLSLDRTKAPYYGWRTGFEELRIRPYRSRQMTVELESLLELPDKIDHPPDGSKDTCLAAETLVRSLDGKDYRVDQLKAGSKIWVYSLSETGVVPAQATFTGQIRVAPVIRVHLDNGKSFDCTGDHKIFCRDGIPRDAEVLKVGESLMPFKLASSGGRARVWCPVRHKTVKVYRLVYESINGPVYSGFVVHHKNRNKEDDTPDNLVQMEKMAHIRHHGSLAFLEYNARTQTKRDKRAFFKKLHEDIRLGKIVVDYANQTAALVRTNKKRGKEQGKIVKSKWEDGTFTVSRNCRAFLDHVQQLKNQGLNQFKILYNKIIELQNKGLSRPETALKLGVDLNEVYNVVCYARRRGFEMPRASTLRSTTYFKNRQKRIVEANRLRASHVSVGKIAKQLHVSVSTLYNWWSEENHTVVRIEQLGEVPVYCLKVPEYGNFALSCGVWVRNCDAAAGAYWNAINYEQEQGSPSGTEPSLHPDATISTGLVEPPPIDIPIPAIPHATHTFQA